MFTSPILANTFSIELIFSVVVTRKTKKDKLNKFVMKFHLQNRVAKGGGG